MEELTTLPQTPYSAGEATPLPDLTPFGGFGASRPSTLAPPALGFAPIHIISGYTPLTNHKFRVGLHVGLTFGLNVRHIAIQYPSWSAKGFGEAIELLIARWVKPDGLCIFC